MRRVSFTTTGWSDAPNALLSNGLLGSVRLPTVVAICERDDGSIWLIDAGYSREICDDPVAALGRARSRSLGLRLCKGDDLSSQLRRAGLDPCNVSTIIATHLHLDHISGCRDFPNAELVTVCSELDAAKRSGAFGGYRYKDLDSVARLRVISLDDAPLLSFPRSCALDNEIAIVATPGHTKGHLAVLVRNGDGAFLHAGDSAYLRRHYRNNTLSVLTRLIAQDKAELRQTYERLRQSEMLPGALRIVVSHDPEVYEQLPKLMCG